MPTTVPPVGRSSQAAVGRVDRTDRRVRLASYNRAVRAPEDVGDAGGLRVDRGEPDARGDRQGFALERDPGRGQRVVGLDGDVAALGRRRVREDHRELVPAEPPEHVTGSQAPPQRVGDPAEHGVAGEVAVRVVDRLEGVEIEEEQDRRLAVAPRALPWRARSSSKRRRFARPVSPSRSTSARNSPSSRRRSVMSASDVTTACGRERRRRSGRALTDAQVTWSSRRANPIVTGRSRCR